MGDLPHSENERALELVSFYLNFIPDHIDKEMIEAIVGDNIQMRDYAYSAIMAAACGLDAYENADDKQMFRKYFVPMIKGLNADEYRADLYYKNIKIPNVSFNNWKLETKKYKPYEAYTFLSCPSRLLSK